MGWDESKHEAKYSTQDSSYKAIRLNAIKTISIH